MLLSVGVRKCGRPSLHGSTKDINPGGQGHVEWVLGRRRGGVRDDARKVELLDQADGSLEVLVPGNVQEAIVKAADDALEEDEAQSRLQDLLVVLILLEGVAQRPDGRVTVTHDVLINILARDIGVELAVLSSDAEAAMEVGAVGAQSGEDQVRADRAMLV